MALPDSSIIELRGVSRFPPRTEWPHESALHEVDLRVAPGGWLRLEGPEGGGRELLFRLLSLTEAADAGEVIVDGQPCLALPPPATAELRARKFGFLSATPFLIPSFNAIENIAVPMLKISRIAMPEAQDRIAELLRFAGLLGQEEKAATDLSPLDQGRLMLARALANAPVALFVESLDAGLTSEETALLSGLLRRASESHGVTIVALGQAAACGSLADERRLEIVDGRIDRDSAVIGSVLP